MSRAGEPCVPHSKSGEKAAAPSYASGEIHNPTLVGSKSSYSSRPCHPRKKESGCLRTKRTREKCLAS